MADRLEILLTGDASGLVRAFDEAGEKAAEAFGKISSESKQAAVAMAGVAATGLALTKAFLDAEAPLEQTEARMKTLSGSSKELQETLEHLHAFQESNKLFDMESIEKASMLLKNLTGDGETLLPVAANLGAQFGNLEGVTKTLALAYEGNSRGMNQVQRQLQITTEELIKAGAQTDAHGKITVKTTAELEAYQKALISVANTKYGDALKNQNETLAGSFASLKNTMEEALADMGKEIAPAVTKAVQALDGLIKEFRELPESTKSLVSWGALIAGILGTLGTMILGATAALGPAALAWTAYTAAAVPAAAATMATSTAFAVAEAAATVLAGTLVACTGPLAIIAVTLAAVTYQMELHNKAANEAISYQEKVATAFRGSTGTIVQCRDALKQFGDVGTAAADHVAVSMKAAGKTNVDVTKAILESMVLLEKAQKDGNQDQIKKNEETLKLLRQVRLELDGTADAQKKVADAAKAAQEDMVANAQKAYESFKTDKGSFIDPKAELAALDVVMQGLQKTAQFNKDAQAEIASLEKERVAVVRKVKEEEIKADVDNIHLLVAEGKMSKDQEAAALRALGDKYAEFADKRRAWAIEAATLERKAAEEQLQAAGKVLEARKGSADAQIANLEAQLKKGGDLIAQQEAITKAIRDRAKLEEDIIKNQLALDVKKDPSQRVALEAEAAAKIKTINENLSHSLIQLSDEVREHEVQRLDAQVKVAEAAVKGADAEIASLRERLKTGADVDAQLVKELQTREKLAEAAIQAQKKVVEKSEQDPTARAEKLKALDQEVADNRKKLITEVAKVQSDADARHKKDVEEAAALDVKIAQAKINGMQAEFKLGKEMDQNYLAAIKEREAAQVAALRAKADAEEAGKNTAETARIEKQYTLDLLLLNKQNAEEQEKVKAEILAQTAALKAQKDEFSGKTMSFADAMKAQHASFNFDDEGKDSSAPDNSEAQAKQKQIDDAYLEGLKKVKDGSKKPNDPDAAGAAAATGGSPSAPLGGAATMGVLRDILKALQDIAGKPTQIKIGGGPTATENSSESYQWNTGKSYNG